MTAEEVLSQLLNPLHHLAVASSVPPPGSGSKAMHPHTNISRALLPRTGRKHTTPGFHLCLEAFVQRSLSLHQHFLTGLTFGDKKRRKIGSHKGETCPYCFTFCCPRSHLPRSWKGFNLIITFSEAFVSADRGDTVRAATATGQQAAWRCSISYSTRAGNLWDSRKRPTLFQWLLEGSG